MGNDRDESPMADPGGVYGNKIGTRLGSIRMYRGGGDYRDEKERNGLG